MRTVRSLICCIAVMILWSCQPSEESFDVLILGGKIVDGSGNPWYYGDVGIRGDKIVAIGKLKGRQAKTMVAAAGKIVTPGFIDMLGQSELTLLIDNRAMSKISQGITTEVTGEGESVAPVNDRIMKEMRPFLEKYNLHVDWKDFDGYFKRLERNKSAVNLASFVGATQVREYVIGYDARDPAPQELDEMKQLVREAMQQGALGVSTSLIYAPATYAKTPELIELAKVAAEFGGLYISHIRDEGDEGKEIQAVYEAADVSRTAKLPVEIWHLKVAAKRNWGMMPQIVHLIQQHRDQGIDMTADLYPYNASANSLDATIPGWAHDGGTEQLLRRLSDKETREKIKKELKESNEKTGVDFDAILISEVYKPELKQYEGKRMSEIAKTWKKGPYDAMFDFILADSSRTGRVTFSMHEQDVRLALAQPWTSFCTDYNAAATDGPFSNAKPHPRTYGSFPKVLGKYVRDEKLVSLEDAIRKMSSLPAARVGLKHRGLLKPGFYADVVVFDLAKVKDKATFENPHQYSEGIENVFVNGQAVWEGGKFTGNLPGKPLRGPGYKE